MGTISALHITVSAQDVHFSQFFNAPLTLNPALTGAIATGQRAALIHRSQWQRLGAPFRTFAFSYDVPLLRGRMKGRYLGVGASAYSDKAGKSGYGDTQGGISIAYGLRTGRDGAIALGMQAAYSQRSAVLDGLRWDAQYDGSGYDPSRPTGESIPNASTSFIDLSSGITWQQWDGENVQWSAGFAAFHLNQPSVTLFGSGVDVLQRRYTLHASARFASKRWVYLPQAYASQQGGTREIVFGGLMHRRVGTDSRYTTDKTSSSFHVGMFYRWNDAVVPMVQVEFKRLITAGISYDVNISGLRNATRYKGGMEVTLRYIGGFGDKRRQLPRRSAVN